MRGVKWISAGAIALMLGACGGRPPEPVERARTAAPIALPAPRPAPPRRVAPPPSPALEASITALGRGFDGKVGIAVTRADADWMLDWQGGMLFPQQSVSKLWVAMTVLDQLDAGRLTLADPVTVRREDLTLFHQPIARLVRGEGYETNVDDLIQRAMRQSDNTANDRLLSFIGGPGAVQRYSVRKGLGAIRFGPGERQLQSQTAGLRWRQDYAFGRAFYTARAALSEPIRRSAFNGYIADPADGASPAAIARALIRLHRGALLSPGSTAYLLAQMESSNTGKARMGGAVPLYWRFGHKTGTGQDFMGRTAGYNDVGLLTAPDGTTYAVAVMIAETGQPIRVRQALMQAVITSVVANHRR